MEWRITLAAIFAAVAIVGAMETIYQIYQVTVIDAAARGLKHPKLWGMLAANGNNSSGLLLYLIGRRNTHGMQLTSNSYSLWIKRKKLRESVWYFWRLVRSGWLCAWRELVYRQGKGSKIKCNDF